MQRMIRENLFARVTLGEKAENGVRKQTLKLKARHRVPSR
jgi:hypothetical protein